MLTQDPPRTGRRDRKKAATRQALHEAALRLALERGPAEVTVDEIADAADVSRRTFNNYFPSKEAAVCHGDVERMRRLIALVAARPGDEDPWTSLVAAARRLVAEADDVDPVWRDHRRRLRRHPALAAYRMAAFGAVERELATTVARRLPAGRDAVLRARVLVARLGAALRVAEEHWLDDGARPIEAVVRDALAYAAA